MLIQLRRGIPLLWRRTSKSASSVLALKNRSTSSHPLLLHATRSSASNVLPSSYLTLSSPSDAATCTQRPSSLSSFGAVRGYREGNADSDDGGKEELTKELSGITVARSKGGQSGYCYGCGADLVKGQTGSVEAIRKKAGFWAEKDHDLKKAKLKNWALCPRCKQLRKMDEEGELRDVDRYSPDSKMTEVFRREVSKIRTKEDAVVVLCCDAVNVNGSLIKGIRKYIGGNPILLAVTRCDLLPQYMWKGRHPDEIKELFRERSKDIIPAEIYLCSEEKKMLTNIGGIQKLSVDLWKHLNGRDVYIVGVANIGKSTLTDILISGFVNKGEELRHFHDKMGFKRVKTLRDIRITKSSLPGTTLQNVRVPCFRDHHQALWDTPGLLVDTSLKQFPIRNFKSLRAQRPSQIEPQIHVESERKSLALLITEKDDDIPLLRLEIRLKKSAKGEGPIRLVWNSILNLDSKVVDIEEAQQEEAKRAKEQSEREEKDAAYWKEKKEAEARESGPLTPEQKARKKEERLRALEAQARQEKLELGNVEYERREKEKLQEIEEKKRFKMLSQLTKIHEILVEKDKGLDVAIANFGWLGVLMPRTAMIRVFAPKTGIQIAEYETLGLPPEWGDDFMGMLDHPSAGLMDSSSGQTGSGDDEEDAGAKYEPNADEYDFGEFGGGFNDELDGYGMDGFDGDDDPYAEYGGLEDMGEMEESFDFSNGDGGQIVSRRPQRYENRHDYKKKGKGKKKRGGRGGGDDYDDDDDDDDGGGGRGGGRPDDAPNFGPNYWEDYRGVNVGYQFDRDMRWNDKIGEGWNPIRQSSKKEIEEMKKLQEDLPFKDHSKYYDNPLEF